MAVVGVVITAALWARFAVSPTIGSALIAAIASVANTGLLVWHDRRSSARLEARRIVVTKIPDDDDDAVVVITPEDRRELEDRRARAEKTRRDRRHRRRRK